MLTHYSKLNRPKKSSVYDQYWRFALERNEVFYKKLKHHHTNCTNDPVLKKYRFTNVFRASDRVSQYLINTQYNSSLNDEDIFFKTILFKIFNKIETYQLLERSVEELNYKCFVFDVFDRILTQRMAEGFSIYSAAYIMPSTKTFGYKFKHSNHLALLHNLMKERVYLKIQECSSLEEVYKLLLSVPSFGSFLAFQYTIDLNYSTLINFSEMDFVVAGPGAKSGILKCFSSLGDYSYEDIIKLMVDEQETDCKRLELEVPTLWGRSLQLIDCQNLFCEVDKYLRVTHPEVIGKSNRTRIKQVYTRSNKNPIIFFFPPKWNINNQIE